MKFIENLGKKLNSTQKLIVAISVPSVLLVITLAIADDIGGYGGPFDIEDTWLVWVIYLTVVGYFEFKLFSQTKSE